MRTSRKTTVHLLRVCVNVMLAEASVGSEQAAGIFNSSGRKPWGIGEKGKILSSSVSDFPGFRPGVKERWRPFGSKLQHLGGVN